MINCFYEYFGRSSKISAKWIKFQNEIDVKEIKISKYIETRWFSQEDCILRILERWDELLNFFTNEENISYEFLKFFLNKVNDIQYFSKSIVLLKKRNYRENFFVSEKFSVIYI